MKFLTLKTKFNKGLLLLGLISAVSITENVFAAPRRPQVNANPEAQIASVLEQCLFDRNNKKPFTYFVDELIRIVTTYKDQLEANSGKAGLAQRFAQDMKSIRNSKNALQVGKILARYKNFMPPSLKQKKITQLLAGLKFRLAIADDGSFDESVAATNQGYLNAFIGYCKLLLESGREYFT